MPVKRRRNKKKLKAKYIRRRVLAVISIILIIISICIVVDLIQQDNDYRLILGENSTKGAAKEGLKTEPASSVTKEPSYTATPLATPSADSAKQTEKPSAAKVSNFDAQLYFPDDNFIYLKKISAVLSFRSATDIADSAKLQIIVEALEKGLKSEQYRTAVPKGTKAIDVQISGKTVTLNLSEEFMNIETDSSMVRLTLGQVVLSCGELGYDQVIIKINGKQAEGYPGDVDLSMPLKKSDYLNVIY